MVWENETLQFYRLESGGGLCIALISLIETVPICPLQVQQWCVPSFRFIIEGAQRKDLSTDCQNDRPSFFRE